MEVQRLTPAASLLPNMTAHYQYDPLGRRVKKTHPNGTFTTYAYDAASRLLSLHNDHSTTGPLSHFDYTYDRVGNRMSKTELVGFTGSPDHGVTTYAYDPLYRLTKADYPEGYPFADETFQYDPVGNRLARTVFPSPGTGEGGGEGFHYHAYDPANRLLEDDEFTYDWDLNGNMISKTPKCPTPDPCSPTPTRYRYDAENMMRGCPSHD